ESSVFKTLAIDWTPVFTGVTAEIQFFHIFPSEGGVRVGRKISPPVNSYGAKRKIIFGYPGLRNPKTLEPIICTYWIT
ncbi:MAG: hypothetical protein NTV04_07805, partial [Deltaproteobacteria bacterium]|nr:hypothetical protein [Deltaproteobacteria bacterium]